MVENTFFDTLVIEVTDANPIHKKALEYKFNFRKISNNLIGLSFDETTTDEDVKTILNLFSENTSMSKNVDDVLPENLIRKSLYLTHEVFNSYHSETQILRYIRSLADKDIALDRSMIPLGSCTMKLNATSEMIPVGWNGFANIHPHAPEEQVQGYLQLIDDLEKCCLILRATRQYLCNLMQVLKENMQVYWRLIIITKPTKILRGIYV